jgi:hypothetical protein
MIKTRFMTAVLVASMIPATATARSIEGQVTATAVTVGQRQVQLMEAVDKGALIHFLPPGVKDTSLFEALDQQYTSQLNSQMKAKADEAQKQAVQAASLAANGADISPDGHAQIQEVSYRSGTKSGMNGNARSYSSHSGYRDRGSWRTPVSIDAAGFSSGAWWSSGNPQQIILNEQLCFSGAALTISWPPSLSGSSSCGSYQSSPWSGTSYVSQSYSNAHASSWIGLFGTTQSDSATVRINYHDYRPSSQVSLSFGL